MNIDTTQPIPIDTGAVDTYNQNDVERIIASAVNQAIAQYRTQRAHLENAINPDHPPNGKENEFMPSKFRERIKVGVDDLGQPIYTWVSASTKDGLHHEIARVLSETAAPPAQAGAQYAGNTPWCELANEWFKIFHAPKVRPKTLSKDTCLFDKHVLGAFGSRPVQSITASEVQTYLMSKSMFCKSQVRDIMSMLRQIFSLAVDKDCITKNPMQSSLVFNPSRKPDRPRSAISQEAQADIIAHIEDLRNVYDKNGDNMNALRFMAFLMYTGLRPCEIYGLRWEDINPDDMVLTVRRDLVFVSGEGIIGEPKTEESKRTIPFDPELLRLISPVESSGFIIHMTEHGREEEHFTERASQTMWRRIKKNINVHGMTPYMGRHTYATNMNKSGVPIKTAMTMMGHKDERMLLRRYTHTDAEDLTNASASVSGRLASMKAEQQAVKRDTL